MSVNVGEKAPDFEALDTKLKAVSLFSGGKDSFLSAQIALEQGFEIIAAITVVPDPFSTGAYKT